MYTKRGQLQPGALSAAERSYPTSEVRGSGRECQAAMAQERPRGATQVRGQWRPGGDTPRLRSGVAAEKSYPVSEARGGGREELPRVQGRGAWESHLAPEARGGSQEAQPEEQWLRRHRRA